VLASRSPDRGGIQQNAVVSHLLAFPNNRSLLTRNTFQRARLHSHTLTQFYFNDEPEMRDQGGNVYKFRKTYDEVEITTNEIIVGLTQTVTVEAGTGSFADQVRVRLVEGDEPFCLTRREDVAIWGSCDDPEEQASDCVALAPGA
jgi:hypothetical protein